MSNQKECLVIDDDQDDQEIFLMCLNGISKHIHCTIANNGVEALAMLGPDNGYTPDYIFLDVNMPKMNGVECLKRLKQIERLRHTRIFMYSTTSEGTALDESRKLGAADFIVKPRKTGELKEKLSAIFEIASKVKT